MGEILRSVKYSGADALKFEKVALRLGRAKRVVFSQMVDYFHRTRKDPLDIGDELLRNTMLKGQKDQIGFIRTQESELLIPIKRDVARLVEAVKKVVDGLGSEVLGTNAEILENQVVHSKKISRLGDAVGTMVSRLDDKREMKEKVLHLVEGYIRERESFSMMTPAREKEELANRLRTQIELL